MYNSICVVLLINISEEIRTLTLCVFIRSANKIVNKNKWTILKQQSSRSDAFYIQLDNHVLMLFLRLGILNNVALYLVL